ncbi:HNH endonuclease [Bdellovibrio bacteriovorus]|uniref:HNH endonuclease n=1 Tax=Bdellovibrio bacteriovorus TaxID=959 RepID=UPI0035A6B07A
MENKHLFEFQNTSNEQLLLRFEKLVRTERKITHLVLLHIAEIEERKIYADLGFDGMYSYLTRGLGYSEGSAYRRLQSARLLKQVPAVAEKIENGSLNLTQLTEVQKCTKGQSAIIAQEVLSKIENKNTFETHKVLAVELGLPIQIHEKLKPQADDSVRMEITLTKEQFQELEQAKSLLSHICPDGSWSEIISILAKKFNTKKLAGRNTLTKENKPTVLKIPTQSVNATAVLQSLSRTSSSRKYISVHTKRRLLQKSGGCCEFINPITKQKCGSKFQLQLDHIQPLALGGSNEINNLRILCRTHNIQAAERCGLDFKTQKN